MYVGPIQWLEFMSFYWWLVNNSGIYGPPYSTVMFGVHVCRTSPLPKGATTGGHDLPNFYVDPAPNFLVFCVYIAYAWDPPNFRQMVALDPPTFNTWLRSCPYHLFCTSVRLKPPPPPAWKRNNIVIGMHNYLLSFSLYRPTLSSPKNDKTIFRPSPKNKQTVTREDIPLRT